MDELRFLIETYLDYQKDRIRFDNRYNSLPEELRDSTFFRTLARRVHSLERGIARRVAEVVREDPLYTRYLRYQKGIGPMMAGYIISWLCRPREFRMYGVFEKLGEGRYRRRWRGQTVEVELPSYAEVVEENLSSEPPYILVRMPPAVEVAENPSDLHMYSGLAPGCRRARGNPTRYNPRLKDLMMWKIPAQLFRARGEWYRIYLRDKEEYGRRCPDPEKGSRRKKVHYTAVKMTMRKFLTNLWLVYRWMNGLPTTEPYPVKLGLQHEILQPFIETREGVVYLSRESFTGA